MDSQVPTLANFTIAASKPAYGPQINRIIRRTFDVSMDEECDDCLDTPHVAAHVAQFPEGQFVALTKNPDGSDKVVGVAATMRVRREPTEQPLPWLVATGTLFAHNHDPDGSWLYGIDVAVDADYRRRGIGTALYNARFDLVRRLNLKGWYSGGVLMGYYRYRDQMTPREYGEAVIRGEIIDPTVTMQMNRGFRAVKVIENYLDSPRSGDAAMLIVWDNPDYQAEG